LVKEESELKIFITSLYTELLYAWDERIWLFLSFISLELVPFELPFVSLIIFSGLLIGVIDSTVTVFVI